MWANENSCIWRVERKAKQERLIISWNARYFMFYLYLQIKTFFIFFCEKFISSFTSLILILKLKLLVIATFYSEWKVARFYRNFLNNILHRWERKASCYKHVKCIYVTTYVWWDLCCINALVNKVRLHCAINIKLLHSIYLKDKLNPIIHSGVHTQKYTKIF
jgi:hypothetical protein